ncbi:MAG: hypothetical protein ACLFP4_10475 [Spirochaetales bacterium]
MELTCLSVPNPLSYLLCYGIANVENRGFDTDYRGPLYIHSVGKQAISGMPDLSEYPVPLIQEFDNLMQTMAQLEEATRFVGVPESGLRIYLKNEDRQPERVVSEYSLLSDVYAAHRANPRKPFFHVQAIIGKVDLVDVVTDSDSPWAREGSYHWILEKPVIVKEPILHVVSSRTGLWKYTLKE